MLSKHLFKAVTFCLSFRFLLNTGLTVYFAFFLRNSSVKPYFLEKKKEDYKSGAVMVKRPHITIGVAKNFQGLSIFSCSFR